MSILLQTSVYKFMINYSRLEYEPQEKLGRQMIYGILAENKLHLSEIARYLKLK